MITCHTDIPEKIKAILIAALVHYINTSLLERLYSDDDIREARDFILSYNCDKSD